MAKNSTPNDTPRVAVYARISVTTDESTSIVRQQEQGAAWATLKGGTLVETFTDDGVSGATAPDKRPGLAAALAAAEAGQFDVLVVAKLDRLARDVRSFLDLAERLAEYGVTLVSLAESLDLATPAGRMVATVLAAFASMERERIGERVADSNRYLASQGAWLGGPAPYGWAKVRQADGRIRLELDPEAAATMRTVVEAVTAGETVASQLHLVPMTDQGLRNWLRHPVLLGRHVYLGDVVNGADGLPMTPHQPLLTWGEWSALQAALDTAAPRVAASRGWGGTDALLAGTGLLVCGVCGRGMVVNRQKRSDVPGGLRIVYRCRKGCVSAGAAAVDAAVEAEFLEGLGRMNVVQVTEVASEASALLEQARERQANLAALVGQGLLPMDAAAEQLATLAETIDRLEHEQGGTVTTTDTGQTFAATWEASDVEGRRELLTTALAAVEVATSNRAPRFNPERLTLRWAS